MRGAGPGATAAIAAQRLDSTSRQTVGAGAVMLAVVAALTDARTCAMLIGTVELANSGRCSPTADHIRGNMIDRSRTSIGAACRTVGAASGSERLWLPRTRPRVIVAGWSRHAYSRTIARS